MFAIAASSGSCLGTAAPAAGAASAMTAIAINTTRCIQTDARRRLCLECPAAMKLVTYDAGAGTRAGIQTDDGIFDAGYATVGELLRAGALDGLAASGDPVQGARLLAPVTDPEKIICIGLNYRSHAEEQGAEPPETPTIFAKYRNALVAPDSEV